MMGLNAMTIQDCVIKNIKGATGGGRGGIFLWNGINNPTVQRNQIIGCDRGIAMGNPAAPGHVYMPGYHVTGGIVRNNFVTRGAGIGMELCFTKNLEICYNTIYSADAGYSRTVSIYDTSGDATVNLQLKYNIIRGLVSNTSTGSGNVTETGDITGSTPATNWFVAPDTGDLHLTSNATLAIDHGVSLPEVTDDFDKQARDSTPDVGADEYTGAPVNQPPTVDAGSNQAITWPTNVVNLAGTASDDGLPNPPGAITTTWSKVSGPGTVTFGNVYALSTTATFGQAGTYVLQLLADDSALQSTDTVTITVNPMPTVQFTSATGSGSESVTTVNIPVSLSAASGQTVTVQYAVTGGTATGGGVDYTLAAGQLTFNPGVTSQNIVMTVVDDSLPESNETVIITLSSPTNATLGTNTTYTYTIIDNDTAPMPTFVAAGAVASGTGTISPALPSGLQTNDILLLFLETANQTISISNQNGGTWTQVTGSPQGTGTAGGSSATCLTAFWSRYNGSQGAPTTSDSGNHQLGRMIAIRGATTSGNPWDVEAGGVDATSNTSGSIPGTTTTVANTLVVVAIATSLPDASGTANFSGWTNANLSSLTERTDNTVTAGNGGGLGLATGGKATAGAYGATAVTLANAAVKGMMSIALKP